MSGPDTLDPRWEELRAFVADAWAGRSAAERQAFAGDLLEDSERIAQAKAANIGAETAPAIELVSVAVEPMWDAPGIELALSTPTQAFRVTGVRSRPVTRAPAQPAPTPPAEPPVDPDALEVASAYAETLAALSGAVMPAHLVRDLEPALQRETLARIAPRFDRTLVDATRNDWSWMLGVIDRRAALARLREDGVDAVLAGAERVPTDAAGRWLRAIAGGERFGKGLDWRNAAELHAIIQALAWAQPLDPALEPLLAEARREGELAGLLSGYDRLLADGFFGRERESRRLRAFVDSLPGVAQAAGAIPILGVSGIGGAGKSTLLAHLLRPLTDAARHDPSAPVVIALDFDRRSFVEGGELEWSFEVTRQIGLLVPACEQALANLRASTREMRARLGEDRNAADGAALELTSRYAHTFEQEAGRAIEEAGLADRGMLLVIDTFEEWQRGAWNSWDRDAPAMRVLEWVSRLSHMLGVTPGLIVSGRAPANIQGYVAAADPITLGDLVQAEARALLVHLGVAAGDAGRLAKLVGGNPLSLKIAARHMRTAAGVRLADLSLDTTVPEGLTGALRQGVLYRRFLDHIPDADVRRLAHPGLALRRVTPELIVNVLAGPCGLGPVSQSRAEDLCAKLEKEAWLVEREGDALVHRLDVRRSTLAAMRSDPEQGPRVRAVHEAAARWFEVDRPDAVEAAYHRCALAQVDGEKGAGIPREILQQLAGALDDFDPPVRALLRDRLNLRLSAADVALLPEYRRRLWTENRAADLLARGQPGGALRFWRKGGFGPSTAPWYVQAAFQAPEWDAPVPFHTANADGQLGRGRLAYAYLIAFSRTDETRRRAEIALVDRLQDEQTASGMHAKPITEVVFENLFFRRVASRASGLGRGGEPRDLTRQTFELQASGLAGTDVRRLAAVLPQAERFDRIDSRKLLAQTFRPSLAWLEVLSARMWADGVDAGPLDWLREQLASASAAQTTADLLGVTADALAQAVRSAYTVMPPTLVLLDMVGRVPDDPEWRVPIRETLADALADPKDFAPFAERLQPIFDLVPIDLRPDALVDDHRTAPRGMWLRLVEYADRCRAMGRLLDAAAPVGNAALDTVAQAYSRWSAASVAMFERRERLGR